MKSRSLAAALFACASLLAGTVSQAQEFPTRIVRVISAFPTGSGPDAAARVLAQILSRYWGQQVIVDPRPGGSGFIAGEAVKNSRPDGHDLLITDDGQITINPNLYKKMPFDVERDFAPAAMFFRTNFFIAVAANGPIKTPKDLTAMAAAKPGSVSYGSPRIGSPSHLGGAEYEMLTNTKMIHVPFTETNQLFASVAAGDVTWGLGTIATTGPLVRGGKLRLIAVASDKRSPDMPDVPTVAESGGPANYEVAAWVGFLAPRGTPPATLEKINRDVARALREPEMQGFLAKVGFEPSFSTREEMAARIRTETRRNGERVIRAGAKAE